MTKYSFELIYPDNNSPISVDQVMRQLLIPRKWRHYLRSEKQILINGKYLPLNFLVNSGDKIQINLTHVESLQQTYQPSGHLPNIVYEDDNVLVINKPAGQKTHPNLNEKDTALNDCATYLGTSPYIVHRLDMLTSGLLLVAKNPAVVPILNRQLTTKTFHRNYFATVNNPENLHASGTISAPIGQDPNDQRKRMICSTGLKSITHYQLLKRNSKTALVKLTLETGRTHQIRVHLASIGSPILGDPLYNPNFNGEQLHLTAYQMSFLSPFSFTRQTIQLRV
ncbi:RluA family pseudouridine synthase [Lactobacillus sp.]|uniref:RluA family pseudouridine synthase n=1 Tax=Lactobacillus sp. TaxID=1591 RepID=UPI00198BBFB4|nr:RluA family pseudouridine synthase [Lactobacillus sp.]MBD5429078.1 RluA family pseudouridine synthase [Lactobacillus sp.]